MSRFVQSALLLVLANLCFGQNLEESVRPNARPNRRAKAPNEELDVTNRRVFDHGSLSIMLLSFCRGRCVQEFGLVPDIWKEVRAAHESDFDIPQELRISRRTSISDRYEQIFHNQELDRHNQRISKTVLSLVKDAQQKRLKQICTLEAIELGLLESALIMNDIQITEDQYARLCKERYDREDKAKKDPKTDYLAKYDTALRYMRPVLKGIDIDDAAGDLFPGRLGRKANISPAMTAYQQAPLRIVQRAEIQEELGLTPKMVVDLRNLLSKHQSKTDSRAEQLSRTDADFAAKMKEWRETVDADIERALVTPDRLKRFNQLMFQHYIREQQVIWALKYAGRKLQVGRHIPFDSASLRYEVKQKQFCNDIVEGCELLMPIVGSAKLRSIIGKVTLTPGFSKGKEPEAMKRIREELERDLRARIWKDDDRSRTRSERRIRR